MEEVETGNKKVKYVFNNNNNRRLVTLAEHKYVFAMDYSWYRPFAWLMVPPFLLLQQSI